MNFAVFLLNDDLNFLFPEFYKNKGDEHWMHLRDLIVDGNPEAYQVAFGISTLYCSVDDDVHPIEDVIKFEVLPDGNFYGEDIIRVQYTDWAVHHMDFWHTESITCEE